MPSPLLSVVIPTWNRVELVQEAIQSALSQRPGEVEVIVVDDGSTQDVQGVLKQVFGETVRIHRRQQRGGASAARNVGFGLATGELIAFLDSDDIWLPGKLEAELRVLERNPTADGVATDNLHYKEGQREARTRFEANGLLESSRTWNSRWVGDCRGVWTRGSALATCSLTMRRSALDFLGGALYDDDLLEHQDWLFEILVVHRSRVYLLPEVWAHVRQFDDGTRPDRVAPGNQRSRAKQRRFLEGKVKVLDRALAVEDLPQWAQEELKTARRDFLRELDASEEQVG